MPVWNFIQGSTGGNATVSGTLNPITDVLSINSNGQTSFTLSTLPFDANDISLFLNGVRQRKSTDFSVSSTSLSWLSSTQLDTSDSLIAFYFGVSV